MIFDEENIDLSQYLSDLKSEDINLKIYALSKIPSIAELLGFLNFK